LNGREMIEQRQNSWDWKETNRILTDETGEVCVKSGAGVPE
jgi:hypothetical protein